ncbi:adenosine kinase [Niastella yeongjuensis]|uniref:Adenosine kinase n=1 Tax=Niastella yeongjuensis TaxID=354355 RepID=A0A1V9EFR2_9BACT|nr:adenosine kinase [Niastella yeongjuensis]OQP44794.1 adenosine kinase [Niastella yeongjuensis]SEP42361.1 adenosine deaminase-related growth factor [Niastella yeongjuensis]
MFKSTITTLVGFIFSCSLYAQELTPKETQLDKRLSALRNELLVKADQIKLSIYNSTFTQLKPFIESSALYKLLQSMPKGGLLHCHNGAIANPSWVISAAASYKNCYLYTGNDEKEFIYGQLAVFTKGHAPTGFVPLQQYLQHDKKSADSLLKLLTLNRHDLSDYMDTWVEFEKRFKRIGNLANYRPFFKEYYQEAFNELLKDNVQHVEIRYGFGQLFDENNDNYPADTAISDLKAIVAGIQRTHPDFTLKLIYSSFKFLDTTAVAKALSEAFQLKQKYPELITGFDLVADEATNHTVGYYTPVWNSIHTQEKRYGIAMPLYLHAGESSTIANTNLQEVPFQLNKRIGHGLNLVYFPETMQQVKTAHNLVEVSPISNQELGYVSDLRNHPARVLLANGVLISINSDDPGVYGYNGLSYDFWIAFMAWDLDLRTLKKLITNSLLYASLTEEEKKRALLHFYNEWNRFVEAANR